MSLSSGTTLGPYIIIDQLGAGGMGEVYRARDNRLDRQVAVKVLPSRIADDPQNRTRFEREAKALAALSHPNIVSIFDIGSHGEITYAVTEFLQGQTLRRRLATGPIAWQHAVAIGIEIAEGLSAAHSKGIVHRDLKPENVFLTSNGRLKIVDFGLAHVARSSHPEADTGPANMISTDPGTVIGTLGYMAPEQVRGEAVDARSDLFSFGCVMYEILSGKRPFGRTNPADVISAILRDEPEPIDDSTIPAELQHLVFKCLEKDPSNRYSNSDEVLVRLKALEGSTRVDTIITSPPRTLQAPPSSRSLVLPVISIGLILLLTVLLLPSARHTISNWIPGAGSSAPKHIAVLPFHNIGDDPANRALCDGLVETVSSKLTQMEPFQKSLWVIPASEVREEQVNSAAEALQKLGANLAISGSVQQDGERVQVTMNLIDTASTRQLRSSVLLIPQASLSEFEEYALPELTRMVEMELNPGTKQALISGGTNDSGAYATYLQAVGYLQDQEDEKSLQKAIDLFHKSIVIDPKFTQAYSGLGQAYWRLYERTMDPSYVSQAELYCNRALELNGNLTPVLITRGIIQKGTGHAQEAVQTFQRVLKLDPQNFEATRQLAYTYDALGKVDEAENTFKQAIQIRPTYWVGFNNLGFFYASHGRYQEAEKMFQREVDSAPGNVNGYVNLGLTYFFMGRKEDSVRMMEKSITIKPTAEAYSNIGEFYFYQGKYSEAANLYRKAAELQPNNYLFWGNLGDAYRYAAGHNQDALDSFQRAISLISDQIKINPKDPQMRASRALYYAKANQPKEAMEEADEVEKLGPKDVYSLYRCVKVYEILGDHTKALTILKTAVDNGYPLERVEQDPELNDLRKDPEYQKMIPAPAKKTP